MTPMQLVPTRAEDFAALGLEELPHRIKADTLRVNDTIVGIAGFAYLDNGMLMAFANLTDEARRRRVQLHKAALARMKDAKRGARIILARADPSQPAAERWLKRLGFEPSIYNGETVWVCTTSPPKHC